MVMHDFGLDWIDQERLFETAHKTFGRLLKQSQPRSQNYALDPFALLLQHLFSSHER